MNFFLCKCDKNQIQEEKTITDLLDIKNLERTLKDDQKKIQKNENIFEKKNELEDSIISDELKIIDYPYSKKEKFNSYNNNYIQKIVNKKSKIGLVNIPKINDYNKSKNLFMNKCNIPFQKNIKYNNGDLNTFLINCESLFIDDIEYLKDENIIKDIKPKKRNLSKNKNKIIKNNTNNIKNKTKKINKADISILLNKKNMKNYDYKSNNKINSYRNSLNRRTINESLKSCTTKVSTLNNSNKKNKKINSNKKLNLNQKTEEKNYKTKLPSFVNVKSNKVEKSIKTNKTKMNSFCKNTEINNNKKPFNNLNLNLFKDISKKVRENNIAHIINTKRVIKRKLNFKKIDLKKSKKNK